MNFGKKSQFTITKLIAAAGVAFVGYLFITSLPDLRRYIRIRTM